MRAFIGALSLLIAVTASAADVTFVTPQAGGQVFGPQLIEIATDAANVDRVEFYVNGVLAGVARRAPYRIAYDFGADLGSRQLTAKVFSNGYRTTDTATIFTAALTAGESITVDVVEVPIRVRAGRSLRPADLRVRENSVEQTIRELTPGRGAAHFAFVIDRSLSMGNGKLTAARRAVDEAMKMLRPEDTASVVLFNHNVEKPTTVAASRQVVPSGGTSLREAVSSIASADRTYAIVITDGGDRNSQISEENALRRISGTKTVVAALVFGTPSRFLERAAKNTGGALTNTTRADVVSDLRRVMADINSRYTLVYQSHGTRRGWRSIAITARNDVEILNARKGYFAE